MSSGASGDAMIAARGGDSGVRGKQRSRQFSKAFNFPIPDHLHPNLPSTSLRTPVQASAAISAKKALVIAVQLLYSLRRNYTTLLLHMQRRPSDFTSRRRIWHDAMRRTTGNHTGTTTPSTRQSSVRLKVEIRPGWHLRQRPAWCGEPRNRPRETSFVFPIRPLNPALIAPRLAGLSLPHLSRIPPL